VKFENIWQMTNFDGTKETHVVDNATKALIQPYFSETAETFIEYECDVSKVKNIEAEKSVEYIGLWVNDPTVNYQQDWAEIQKIKHLQGDPQNEKPTDEQWDDATNPNTPDDDPAKIAAQAEIRELAQKWANRIDKSYTDARRSWATTIDENAIVAIKYYHPKYSQVANDWQTSEWGNHTWLEITVPGTTNKRPPDSWWRNIGGTSYARGVVSIPKGLTANVIRKNIAHEAAHATRYHFKRAFFGNGIPGDSDADHSSQGLMFPNALSPLSDDKFSQPEINILKGGKKP